MKMLYHKMLYHGIIFHKIQENHDEDKARKTWLLILFVVRIVRQELLEISAG